MAVLWLHWPRFFFTETTSSSSMPLSPFVFFPTRDMIGTPGLAPLTHGNLLYTSWALSTMTRLKPEEVLLRGISRLFQGW